MSQTTKIILLVLISAVIIGGGVCWYINHQRNIAKLAQEIETEESDIFFVSCNNSLYLENPDQYIFWEERFSELYLNLKVYDAGSYCKLSDGKKLISFSYFPTDETVSTVGQKIILFDENDSPIKVTENFYCQTLGDLGYPIFRSLKNNTVTMTCNSFDGGHFLNLVHELDLDTFEFRLISKDTNPPQ